MRAWEFVENKKHVPRTGTSGATDAKFLRAAGIPTARLGMPRRNGRERKSAQPIFYGDQQHRRHETTDQVFGVRRHRHLYTGAARSYEYSCGFELGVNLRSSVCHGI